MLYLASPYTDPDPEVEAARFRAVCTAAAALMRRGEFVFSPIAHAHAIALAGDLPGQFGEYWHTYARQMLEACDSFAILMLPGWADSVGVRAEHDIAVALGLSVAFLPPVPAEVLP
jgi:hypothetical protein